MGNALVCISAFNSGAQDAPARARALDCIAAASCRLNTDQITLLVLVGRRGSVFARSFAVSYAVSGDLLLDRSCLGGALPQKGSQRIPNVRKKLV